MVLTGRNLPAYNSGVCYTFYRKELFLVIAGKVFEVNDI